MPWGCEAEGTRRQGDTETRGTEVLQSPCLPVPVSPCRACVSVSLQVLNAGAGPDLRSPASRVHAGSSAARSRACHGCSASMSRRGGCPSSSSRRRKSAGLRSISRRAIASHRRRREIKAERSAAVKEFVIRKRIEVVRWDWSIGSRRPLGRREMLEIERLGRDAPLHRRAIQRRSHVAAEQMLRAFQLLAKEVIGKPEVEVVRREA